MLKFIKSLFSKKQWPRGCSLFTGFTRWGGFSVVTTIGPDVGCWTTQVFDSSTGDILAWAVSHTNFDAEKKHRWCAEDLCPQLAEWRKDEPLPVFYSNDVIDGCYA